MKPHELSIQKSVLSSNLIGIFSNQELNSVSSEISPADLAILPNLVSRKGRQKESRLSCKSRKENAKYCGIR